MATVVIAADGYPPLGVLGLAFVAILFASSGANGLTNYLDRNIDSIMVRTRHRVLPSKRIDPPQKVLPMLLVLTIAGLIFAWFLHPLAFLVDLIGTIAAVVWRKKVTCVFPQGAIASCAPVLMGWFAIAPAFSWEIVILCALISLWLPSHIWSVMIANREDYMNAGIDFFPINHQVSNVVKILLISSILLYASSIVLYFAGGFHWLYLVAANILGIIIVYGSVRFVLSGASQDGWKLYKLSAFPYLGVLFLVICLDIWLF